MMTRNNDTDWKSYFTSIYPIRYINNGKNFSRKNITPSINSEKRDRNFFEEEIQIAQTH